MQSSPRLTSPSTPCRAFRRCCTPRARSGGSCFASSKDKWSVASGSPLHGQKLTLRNRLRIHHTQEWYDLYQKWANDDLQKFFDRYLLQKANDWDSTPKVRHSLLGFNRDCVVNRPESVYPPSYVEHRTFFLDGQTGTMDDDKPASASGSLSYQSDSWDDDGAHFVHTFTSYTELIGFSQAKLYMSCADADDLDVYVICRKLDAQGRPLMQLNIPLAALPAGTTADAVPDLNIFQIPGPQRPSAGVAPRPRRRAGPDG